MIGLEKKKKQSSRILVSFSLLLIIKKTYSNTVKHQWQKLELLHFLASFFLGIVNNYY